MKNIKLNNEETNAVYRSINRVAYNVANDKDDSPKDGEARKQLYYAVQRNLRRAFLKYDRVTKTAELLRDVKVFDTYVKAKKIPKGFTSELDTLTVASVAKVLKSSPKAKRI